MATPDMPAIRIKRDISMDEIDADTYGKEVGTIFLCGEGDDQIELYMPDIPTLPIELFMFGRDGVDPDDALRVLPVALALLRDPRVVEARRRHEAAAQARESG